MNLADHLDLLATAPDGIRRLRGLILELAVRGKLVPQDPADEPTRELRKRIEAEKARLVREGKIRKPKAVEAVRVDGRPFEAPQGWEWAYALDVCSVITDGDHQPPPKTDKGVPFLVIGDVVAGKVDLTRATRFVPIKYFEELGWQKQPCAGDILYTTVGSYGLAIPVRENLSFCFQRHIGLIRPALRETQGFMQLAFGSSLVRGQAEKCATGIAQKTVPLSGIRAFKVPLPPLAEQHRIVARVDKLMALCDRLEAEQADAAEAHARLVDTLLATLTASRDAAECAANWQRLSEHFDTLFTTEASIAALKQTVLQLAVMGRLVPQDPTDEPSTRSSEGACSDSLPLELPANWTATTLGELCEIAGGMTPTKSRDDYWGDGLPWVSPKDMKVDFITDAQDHITERALSETTIRPIPLGSLLVVVRGMILAHSFPVAITRADVTINQDMKALTPHVSAFAPYLMLVCKGFKYEILNLVERSSHGTCKLETPKLLSFPFGLPPLPEQHRIVAKVDELMALCDRLQADLATAREHRARLADTLVQVALETA